MRFKNKELEKLAKEISSKLDKEYPEWNFGLQKYTTDGFRLRFGFEDELRVRSEDSRLVVEVVLWNWHKIEYQEDFNFETFGKAVFKKVAALT